MDDNNKLLAEVARLRAALNEVDRRIDGVLIFEKTGRETWDKLSEASSYIHKVLKGE